MAAEPIRFYNRYTKTVETEQIYGGKWLRFAYENPAGRFFTWLLVRRALFSRLYGFQMRKKVSALRILPFIVEYNINVDEFLKSPFDFRNFNEFFYRALKPEARPIAPGDKVAVFPADGRHLAFADVDTVDGFYAKGIRFTLDELLGDAELACRFAGGSLLISRLCPVDYHRFHFPVSGTTGEAKLIRGSLYSVSPVALRRSMRYMVENKRMLTMLASPAFGEVGLMEIGATNVGSIVQGFVGGRAVEKGVEKGLFCFGGSCVITLFQRNRIRFDEDILEQSRQHVETYARMGDRLGVAPG